MFSASVKPIIANPCDVYITVQNQFQTIRNLNCFNSYTMIPSTDLITIANVTLDCVDKLSEMSTIYIKKINDSSISVSTNEKIQKMADVHAELLNFIYKFNNISSDISGSFKEITLNNMNQDTVGYIYYDIINRYKLIIYQIFQTIKKINVYVVIVKDKITL